jgi:hypothetical protein
MTRSGLGYQTPETIRTDVPNRVGCHLSATSLGNLGTCFSPQMSLAPFSKPFNCSLATPRYSMIKPLPGVEMLSPAIRKPAIHAFRHRR